MSVGQLRADMSGRNMWLHGNNGTELHNAVVVTQKSGLMFAYIPLAPVTTNCTSLPAHCRARFHTVVIVHPILSRADHLRGRYAQPQDDRIGVKPIRLEYQESNA